MGTSAGRPWDQYLLAGWVVMKSMSVYHLVDHELRVETFFWKEGPPGSGEVDLETSAQVPWRLKKVSCRVFILSFGILVARNSFSKLWVRIEEKIYTKAVVDVPRGNAGRVFLFFWERLTGRRLVETYCSC